MADTQVVMQIPKEVIDAQVRAAVVNALAKDPAALVRAVVDAALAEKTNNYDRTPIWEEKINQMLRDLATEAAKEWVEAQKPELKRQVQERLGLSLKRTGANKVNPLVDKLVDALSKNLVFHIQVRDTGD